MNIIKQITTASVMFALTITCAAVAQADPKNCPVDNGISTRIGPTGFIEVFEYGIFASFREDDQIITVANAAELCSLGVEFQQTAEYSR